jgi:hypothetical protein
MLAGDAIQNLIGTEQGIDASISPEAVVALLLTHSVDAYHLVGDARRVPQQVYAHIARGGTVLAWVTLPSRSELAWWADMHRHGDGSLHCSCILMGGKWSVCMPRFQWRLKGHYVLTDLVEPVAPTGKMAGHGQN